MTSNMDALNDSDYVKLLQPIWEYLAVEQVPQPSDVIFVFGGLDLEVPARASELYLSRFAPIILITGNIGPLTKNVFAQSETYVFKEQMIQRGVPESSIITEDKACNTLENVLFGMKILSESHKSIDSAILVAKSFLMRRCIATFQKHYPKILLYSCPPQGSMLKFIDRPRHEFAERLLAELERIRLYSEKGDISFQPIPKSVEVASSELKSRLRVT